MQTFSLRCRTSKVQNYLPDTFAIGTWNSSFKCFWGKLKSNANTAFEKKGKNFRIFYSSLSSFLDLKEIIIFFLAEISCQGPLPYHNTNKIVKLSSNLFLFFVHNPYTKPRSTSLMFNVDNFELILFSTRALCQFVERVSFKVEQRLAGNSRNPCHQLLDPGR